MIPNQPSCVSWPLHGYLPAQRSTNAATAGRPSIAAEKMTLGYFNFTGARNYFDLRFVLSQNLKLFMRQYYC